MKIRSYEFAKKQLQEFEERGFAESKSNYYFLNALRDNYNEYFKIFDAGQKVSAGRLTKFGIYEVFGKRMNYYYDKRQIGKFVDFLVEKFYAKNPDAGPELQSSFTRILHIHGLCWKGCVLHNSMADIRKFKKMRKKFKKMKNR